MLIEEVGDLADIAYHRTALNEESSYFPVIVDFQN